MYWTSQGTGDKIKPSKGSTHFFQDGFGLCFLWFPALVSPGGICAAAENHQVIR